MDATAIILAAGEGTRMKSNHCKVSHKILGKPMVQWIVDATIKAGCSRVVVVIGSHADEMRASSTAPMPTAPPRSSALSRPSAWAPVTP